MRIEDVQSPCVSLMDAAEIMREAGFRVSVHKLKAGICQGVYPFGEIVERAPGLTKNDVYTIYTAGLADWLEEHRWPRAGAGFGSDARRAGIQNAPGGAAAMDVMKGEKP